MIVRLHHILAAAVLAVALAPAAGAVGYSPPDVRDAAGRAQGGFDDFSPPDVRDAAGRAQSGFDDFSPPDVRDAADRANAPAVQRIVVGPGGFDWGDAGIGAAGALALVAMTAGAVAVGTNRRASPGAGPLGRRNV
jgi:hypothetical protein